MMNMETSSSQTNKYVVLMSEDYTKAMKLLNSVTLAAGLDNIVQFAQAVQLLAQVAEVPAKTEEHTPPPVRVIPTVKQETEVKD